MGEKTTYWWDGVESVWVTEYMVIEEEIKSRSGADANQQFDELPKSGNLVVFLKAHFNDWYFEVDVL